MAGRIALALLTIALLGPARADEPGPLRRGAAVLLEDQRTLVLEWWPSELRRPRFSVPLLSGIALAGSSTHEGPDLTLERWFDAEVEGGATDVARGLTSAGNPLTVLAAVSATAVIARHDNPRLSSACSRAARALVAAQVWTQAVKTAAARERPVGDTEGRFFRYDAEPGTITGSFVSGHASAGFAVARVLHESYPDRPWVGRAAFGTAGLIALSRVGLGRHFPSDILVGGLIGDSVGRMVSGGDAGRRTRPRAWRLRPARDGVVLVVSWP